MPRPLEQGLVSGIVLLNAYCFGAHCVERFVNYQTWHLIPADAFKAYHRAQQPLIQAFVVAPMGVGFVLQIQLAFSALAGIDALVAWVMVAASAAGAFSTVMLQLPIQRPSIGTATRLNLCESCCGPTGSGKLQMPCAWPQRWTSCISYSARVGAQTTQLAQ